MKVLKDKIRFFRYNSKKWLVETSKITINIDI
jgi:hypothetical protein